MSRTGSWGIFAAVVALGVAIAAPARAELICGDFNDDHDVSAPDALGALRTAVGLDDCQRAVCDWTGDGDITTRDALAILRASVGTDDDPRCPVGGCNGPECEPTCPSKSVDCCDPTTCSGNGTCTVEKGVAVCDCDDGFVGASCNAPAERYPFATKPTQDPPVWTKIGDVFVRPPSYGEQMRLNLLPGTFFVANDLLRGHITGGKEETTVPFVFPDGQLRRFDLEIKDKFTSDVVSLERRAAGSFAQIIERNPEVTIYRSLYESDGSVRSVLRILALDDGSFVARGIARHDANQPELEGPFRMRVAPFDPVGELDDIVPASGTIDDSSLLITEAFFANTHQAELFDDCNGLSICADLCADMGVDIGDPGPACPPPPDPCEHVSPCGEGHGEGDPFFIHHCNDGLDNDDDGLEDGQDPQCDHKPTCEPGGDIPQHVHHWEAGMDFGIFGDVLWCTYNKNSWQADLLDRGWHAETPFHRTTGDAEYDQLYRWGNEFFSVYEKLARLKVMGCWVMDSIAESEECADDLSECGPFASGAHTYPYHYGRDAEGFWRGVKVDAWHARGIGMNEPLTSAHALTKNLIGASEAESAPGFASVVGTNVTGDLDSTPHELGHTANMSHCDVVQIGGLWTLEGNTLQISTCPPEGEYGNHQQSRWSPVTGGKLYDCFSDGCAFPRFGDADPD
jgi:hypothetical protein